MLWSKICVQLPDNLGFITEKALDNSAIRPQGGSPADTNPSNTGIRYPYSIEASSTMHPLHIPTPFNSPTPFRATPVPLVPPKSVQSHVQNCKKQHSSYTLWISRNSGRKSSTATQFLPPPVDAVDLRKNFKELRHANQ